MHEGVGNEILIEKEKMFGDSFKMGLRLEYNCGSGGNVSRSQSSILSFVSFLPSFSCFTTWTGHFSFTSDRDEWIAPFHRHLLIETLNDGLIKPGWRAQAPPSDDDQTG